MNKLKKNLIIPFLVFFSCLQMYSQAPNTMYFMKNVPYRHTLNPSLQPTQDFYLSLPILSYTHLNLSNNSVSLKEIFHNNNQGNTVYFLNPGGNKNNFYNALKPVTMFNTDLKINILGAGIRIYDNYITLDISQRLNSQVFVPKDLFKLLLYGTPSIYENKYNVSNFAFNAETFTDISFGYSHTLDKRLYLGGKIKLLFGNNNKSFSHSAMNLSANIEQWNLNGNGVLNASGGDKLEVLGDFESIRYTSNGLKSIFTTAGFGAGFDVGMSYRIDQNLTFSASLTDVGFINWSKNATNTKYKLDYNYSGIMTQLSDGQSLQVLLDSVKTALINAKEVTHSEKSYNSYLLPKLNIGLEHRFFNDKLSLGLFSTTSIKHQSINEEVTASVNTRHFSWLDATVSTSFFNGRFSNLGAGLGIKTGPLYWFYTMDYIGFENIPIPLQKIDTSLPNITLGAPYNTQAFNFALGVTFAFDNLKWFKSITPSPFYDENSKNQLNSNDCNCGW